MKLNNEYSLMNKKLQSLASNSPVLCIFPYTDAGGTMGFVGFMLSLGGMLQSGGLLDIRGHLLPYPNESSSHAKGLLGPVPTKQRPGMMRLGVGLRPR